MTQLYFNEVRDVESCITAGIPDQDKAEVLLGLIAQYHATKIRIKDANPSISYFRSGFYALELVQNEYDGDDYSIEAIHNVLCQSMEEDIELDFDLIESIKPIL